MVLQAARDFVGGSLGKQRGGQQDSMKAGGQPQPQGGVRRGTWPARLFHISHMDLKTRSFFTHMKANEERASTALPQRHPCPPQRPQLSLP